MFTLVVLSAALAVASARPGAIWGGLATSWNAGLVNSWELTPTSFAAPIGAAPIADIPPIDYNYRGPLSLAPGQPANILAIDGRPLDTLSVNLDKAAHLLAKAVDEERGHLLQKRSIVSSPVVAAPVSTAHIAGASLTPWAGAGVYTPLAPAVVVSPRVVVPARFIAPAPVAVASSVIPISHGSGLGYWWKK